MVDRASVVDALPDGVVACDDAGLVRYVNAFARKLLAWGDELVGQPLESILAPRHRVIRGVPFWRAIAGTTMRVALLRKDGVELESLVCGARNGEVMAVVLRGIPDEGPSERVDAYRLVFDYSPFGIFHFDREGTITACNDKFVDVIGSSRRVLVGLNMQTLKNPGIVRCVKSALAGERASYVGDYTSVTGGKTTPVVVEFAPIVVDGRPSGGVGIVQDVTPVKVAEDALRRTEESFRALIEESPDLVAAYRDGLLVYVNPAFVRASGHASAGELLGRPVADLIRPARNERSFRFSQDDLAGRTVELGFFAKDGRVLDCEASIVDVHFGGGPARVILARDVTERNAIQARLARADRMASLGTLAAGVAHEVNNPLAYVLASLELASRRVAELRASGAPAADALSKSIANARDGAERVRVIVRDLRTFSHGDEDRRGPVDLQGVLESAVNLSMSHIKHRARLERRYEPVPPVLGNETRLGQVFLNLLVNAAQAIPEGRAADHRITIATRADGERVVVEVSDTGTGIAPEIRDRIFEPFVTTKPASIGTGLGLSISYGIVAALGGEIMVDSTPGAGSTFRVVLPAAPPDAQKMLAPVSPPPIPVEPERSRVLVVDDDLPLARVLAAELSPRHEVAIANGGREAMERLLGDDEFDLVLCDIMMPDATGLDVFEHVTRVRPALARRFAFMTGGVLNQELSARLLASGAPKLDKPFDLDELEALLRSRRR